ncbi:HAD-IC family P-type ATPase [Patescibacteria group bacterium]|nr:HAD-IC family P-type ATPase [Patescibacteria group bacterium]MBU1500975.1 HAD-IC family P-type ATPase [Patescibacteria group bacterium]MBU2080605.1 HAD-IC family P-type ATPase [Patescibacteria group bacterium]MBU2124320.1 HAD-IC family P-type ATPase [Patescibacteria group bacterium]MBU2194446.1 HAD-IC family P-type ATPase [Patescibacteria group bacterium]
MLISEHWHARTIKEVEEHLHTSLTKGLTRKEAADRLEEKGANSMPAPERDGLFMKLLNQFKSPITFVLVLAVIATSSLAHYTDALVISAALLLNIVMGLVQEGRASKAFEALKKGEAQYAVVFRGGEPLKISANELVVGDVVVLSAGNAIPADMRLIEVHGLTINESALSGEWLAVEKNTEKAGEESPLVERSGMAYAGTLVASGAGRGVVVAIGGDTEIGRIAVELGKKDESVTPLMKDIRQVAKLILIAVAFIMVGIFALGTARGLPFDETLFTAIALAVASVPEGLPAAVTVVLALGMERILKSGGLVRNLLAAETLGTTSIILTDKTGTLTEGRMTLESYVSLNEVHDNADKGEARTLLTAAVLASNAYVEERPEAEGDEKLVVHGRPIEQAIVLAGLKTGISQQACLSAYPRLDELHFDSARRFGGMLVQNEKNPVAYITGAPEFLLGSMSLVVGANGDAETLTDSMRTHFLRSLETAARDGKRVIGVARVEKDLKAFPPEKELLGYLGAGALVGFLIFSDVIREEAKSAIKDMQDAGARVLMLTGDNPETALAIAKIVGIAEEGERAYTGAELSVLTDAELLEVLTTHTVFSRVAPAEKLRIANVLRDAGEVVAMTGDGVNDAPALRAAAIGVAVGSGTDVAKEASDLVLLDNGFSVITSAIREGRRLRENFKKIFAYMLSTNFSEVILIGFALVVGLPLPILPTQVLWSNLIEGGFMNFAFAFEPLYPSAMKRSPKDPEIARVLSPKLIKLIVLVGSVTATILIGIYLFLLSLELPLDEIQTLMFVAVSVNCIFMAFSMKSLGTPLWRLPLFSNRFLLVSLIGSVAFLFGALYIPFLQVLVHVTEPSMLQLAILFGFGLINLATIEIAKWIFFIREPKESRILTA